MAEEDNTFDFDTTAYLPVGFNANSTYLEEITEIAEVEADESFDFNTANYLPIGFSATDTYLVDIVEIDLEEADEPFDFNTADYLPRIFDVYVNLNIIDTEHYLSCITFPSI
jgi:hypothetical protein